MKKILSIYLLLISISANSALLKSYDFNGDLTDTLGNGSDLIASGGTVNAGNYTFADNQGLLLNSALVDTASYGIEINVQSTNGVIGFRKLIDYQNLASDDGLYIEDGTIRFYNYASFGGAILINTNYTIAIERSAGSISVFLDNVLLFTVADVSNFAVSTGNILNFFEDDTPTAQTESFSGVVNFIRIHDNSSTFGSAPMLAPATPVPFSPLTWFTLIALTLLITIRKSALFIKN